MAMERAIPVDCWIVPSKANIPLARLGSSGNVRDTLRLEGKNVVDVRWKQTSTKDEFDRRHHHFPREYCSPRKTIKQILPDGHNGGEEITHAQDKAQCNSCSLWLYRRRCGSRSLVGCGLLRSYSGVYLGSSPIRGSGAVLVE